MLRIVVAVSMILALVLSVGVVLAEEPDGPGPHSDVHTVVDEDTGIPVPMFQDGRLNAADIAAPVVIYYKTESVPVLDEFGNQMWGDEGGLYFEDVITGIQVLTMNLETGVIDGALEVNLDELKDTVTAAGGKDCCVGEKGAVSLHRSESGWFWVQAPDRDGKTYTFQWEGFDF